VIRLGDPPGLSDFHIVTNGVATTQLPSPIPCPGAAALKLFHSARVLVATNISGPAGVVTFRQSHPTLVASIVVATAGTTRYHSAMILIAFMISMRNTNTIILTERRKVRRSVRRRDE
jgi:hypothetical protein